MSEPFFHLDLFSGIGGFSLAAQTVWGADYHCVGFCEIDPFCQQVLRKNFEGVRIYGDIRGLTRERLLGDIRLASNAESGQSREQTEQEGRQDTGRGDWETTPDTESARLEGRGGCEGEAISRLGQGDRVFPDWSRDWREVAFESCLRGVDDGLPRRVAVLPNGERISESRWRQNALKAYGNAIVPQVAMEIMRAIKEIDHE